MNKMHVPILDLTRQYQSIKSEIDAAVARVLKSGRFILGPEVQAFEREVAKYVGVKHAIGVASGTDALLLSLRALGIGPGDGVIVPSFTFFATAGVVHNVGATPVFADIEPKTFNIEPDSLRRILTTNSEPRTPNHELRTTNSELRTTIKAIIPVHLYGQPADMDAIMAIAKEYNLYVIEDAAQAIGAEYLPPAIPEDEAISRGRKLENHEPRTTHDELRTTHHELSPNTPNRLNEPNKPNKLRVGTIGDLGIFSFFPTKNLGAYGDGGMVITNDDELAERVRILRVHGSKPKYYHHVIGTNSRLDAIQAAILRAKLPHLAEWTAGRQRRADIYDALLGNVREVKTPYRALDRTHIFHQYTIRVLGGKRDALQQYLKEHGIGTQVYYPLPLHLQECFQNLGYKEGDLPISEQASHEVLSLPVFPELKKEEQEHVVNQIKKFFSVRRP